MRRLATLAALALCWSALTRPVLAQETQVLNDPFDPYVAALTSLPETQFSQVGDTTVSQVEINISTFRARATGRVESYLKVEIVYVLSASVPSQRPIGVTEAFYEGGEQADFETIESRLENCVDTRSFGEACRRREILSARLPQSLINRSAFRVQFRNRTSSWRGTVNVPAGTIARNLEALANLR